MEVRDILQETEIKIIPKKKKCKKAKWLSEEALQIAIKSTPRRESGSLCPYVRCVALHTEVSLYEPRLFLRDETH